MITSTGKRNPANPRRVTSSRSGQLGGADLTGARLVNANLAGAQLGRADLTGATLGEADLSDAALGKAKLSHANLSLANLTHANLTDAQLGGADLAAAENVTQQQLDSARGDDQTKLPAGLQRPAHWSAAPPADR